MPPCQHTVSRPLGVIISLAAVALIRLHEKNGPFDEVRRLAAAAKTRHRQRGENNGLLQKNSYPRSFLVHHELQRAVTAEVRADWDPVL